MKLFVGYSKVPKQLQSSARPICHSHTMISTGQEPATIRIAAYRSLPSYALSHGRRYIPVDHEEATKLPPLRTFTLYYNMQSKSVNTNFLFFFINHNN